MSFDELSNRYKNSGSLGKGLAKALVILAQPVLGALPHDTKKKIEAAVQSPWFSVAGSTGLNILHNALIYPMVFMAIAAILHGPAILFSREINNYVLVGLLLAIVEGCYRLKDGILRAKPAEEMVFRAAVYGVPLGVILQPILARHAGVIRDLPIPVDGFYSKGFVEKLERERRYGNVYTVEDRGDAFFLRLDSRDGYPTSVSRTGRSCRTKCRNTITILHLKIVSLLLEVNAPTRKCAAYHPASALFRPSLPRSFRSRSELSGLPIVLKISC